MVAICPHRELQFGALTPVQEFVERRVLWVDWGHQEWLPPSRKLHRASAVHLQLRLQLAAMQSAGAHAGMNALLTGAEARESQCD